MYQYKRGISEKEHLRRMPFLISNQKEVISSLTGNFGAHHLYDGLYIKEGRVFVENVIEEIETKNQLYQIANVHTSTFQISNEEYIESVDLDQNEITYQVKDIRYTKKILLDENTGQLILHYQIENNGNSNIRFRIRPMITNRAFDQVKNSQFLKFTQRSMKNGVMINLSVHDNANLCILSDKLNYDREVEYIHQVKHSTTNAKLEEQLTFEDLLIPGTFEMVIKKKSVETLNLVIATKQFSMNDVHIEQVEKETVEKREEAIRNIPEEYIELRDLARSIQNFDLSQMKITSYPYTFDLKELYQKEEVTLKELLGYMEYLIDDIKAIEGRYIILNRKKEAVLAMDQVKDVIEDLEGLAIEHEKFQYEFAKLKLWYLESLYKVVSDHVKEMGEERLHFVKKILYELIEEKRKRSLLQSIETAALLLNGVKIGRHLLSKFGIEDDRLYEVEIAIKYLIESEFFVPEKNCMKENLDSDMVKPNIPMLYTLSLSYPCVVGDISIKLLDTIFKELYTPYGLRTISKNDIHSDGLIYPKYLAHFIKANLRQNGVTRASKKIAYNLVKELMLDIGKKVNGGVPKVYHERGILIDEVSYDLLTNAEVIRLYDMLT